MAARKNAGHGETTEARCSRCGNPDARIVCGDVHLCEDCYYVYGSCCLESGGDDLWSDRPGG